MKRFRYVVAALVLSVLMVFTSCDGGLPSSSNPSSTTYGRNYYTLKKNMENLDYPKEPNFSRMTASELKQFRKDMASDPDSVGCRVDLKDGAFIFSQGNIYMRQDSDGEWWGAVPFNGEMLIAHYTNTWPDKAWASLLPGKPNLKFVGESIIEYAPDMHQWMGMFVNAYGADADKVLRDYTAKLERNGWMYSSNEHGEYYSKEINGRITLVEFSQFGPFSYVYVLVDGI